MKFRAHTLMIVLLMLAPSVFASSRPVCYPSPKPPQHLNLKEAIALALRSNPQVQIANLQRIVDKYRVIVARNEFEPRYHLNLNGVYRRGEKPVYQGFVGTQVKTPIGTQFSVDVNNIYGVDQSNVVTYSIKQPLLRGAGFDVNLASLRNTLDGEKIQRLQLKQTVMQTITNVILAYNRIILDEQALKINRGSLDNAIATLKATELQIKAGRRAGASLTQQQTQVEQLKLLITRGENVIAQNKRQLLVILGLDPNAKIDINTRPPSDQVRIPPKVSSIRTAYQDNPGFQQAIIGLRQSCRNLKVAQNEQLWDLSITASGTKVLNSSNNDANDHRILVNLDVPIDDKPRKQQLINSDVSYRQAKIALADNKRLLANTVIDGLENMKAQQKQIQIAKQGVAFAQKSLDNALKKYQYGRSSIFEVTSLRQTLTASQQTLVNEQIALYNTQAQFELLLGQTLKRWNIRVVY